LAPGNCYVARANKLEGNVVACKIAKGERRSNAPKGTPVNTSGVDVTTPAQTRSEFSVSSSGNLFRVSLDCKPLFEVEDSSPT